MFTNDRVRVLSHGGRPFKMNKKVRLESRTHQGEVLSARSATGHFVDGRDRRRPLGKTRLKRRAAGRSMVVHMALTLVPGHVFKFIKFQELLKLRRAAVNAASGEDPGPSGSTRRTQGGRQRHYRTQLTWQWQDWRVTFPMCAFNLLKFRRLEGALTLMIV